MPPKLLLNAQQIDILLHRLACQLIEHHGDFSNCVLIGLQPRGVCSRPFGRFTQGEYNINALHQGETRHYFFRDDFRRNEKPHAASSNEMNVPIEGKDIVFIDDVLYTGRSIRAALTAIESYGRPKSIELLNLIDRRFSRDLLIQPTMWVVKLTPSKTIK